LTLYGFLDHKETDLQVWKSDSTSHDKGTDTPCPDDTEKLTGAPGLFGHPERASGELSPSHLPWEEPPAPPPTRTQPQPANVGILVVF